MRNLLASVACVLTAVLLVSCGGSGGSDATPDTLATATATASPAPVAPKDLGTRTGVKHTIRAPDFQALPGATAKFGTLGEAAYRIELPAAWNGELVLFAHGVRLTGTEVFVSNPPAALRQAFIDGGFAWAASSYSENFYVPGVGADDTLALIDHFAATVGQPKRVYIAGESMGGHVAALLLEHHADRIDGALALCGAVAGETQIDFLVSWLALAEATTGMAVPLEGGQAAAAAVLLGRMPAALGAPPALTPAGAQFASAIRELTGGARPFFLEGFALQLAPNFGLLLLDPQRRTLAAGAATNEGLVYAIDETLGLTAAALNAKARRFASDPALRNAATHPDAVPTTGRIADPFLTLHNTGDVFVPISMEREYRLRAEAAGAGAFLVQRAIRAAGHCQFSPEELTRAWADLVGWVRDGTKPLGDDLRGDVSDIGRAFTNPLRAGDPGTE